MSKIELLASFMLFFILPRKMQMFCDVFSSILYTAALSTELSEIANPRRSISPAASVSTKRTNGSSQMDRWEDSDVLLQIMLKLESSLELRDNLEILGKWLTTRTVLTERKLPTEISGIFFINGRQTTRP